MGLLRWLIGISSAISLAVFVVIVTVGKGLGSAYQSGAPGENAARVAANIGLPLLLCAMLASVFFPNARAFLHGVAFFVALAIVGCVALFKSNPGEATLYTGFFLLWTLYYG